MPRRMPALGPSRGIVKRTDPFLALDINPLDEPFNPNLLTPFMTITGRIQPRKDTGLSRRNQRRLGKAIRRAQSMGIIPYFSNQAHNDKGVMSTDLKGSNVFI